MSQPVARRKMTGEEFLAFERASTEKHWLFEGEVYDWRQPQAMTGGSRAHSLLSANVVTALSVALKQRPCEAHGSDLRIYNARNGSYCYADALVVCGEPKFLDGEHDTLENPTLVVEVLSPSNKGSAFQDKLEAYRTLPSLRDYVLVAQDRVSIRHFSRDDDGTWKLRFLEAGETLRPTGVEIAIAVDDVYDKVFAKPA